MNRERQPGFAATELVIVLVIIAIIGIAGYVVLGHGKLAGDKVIDAPNPGNFSRQAMSDKGPVLESLAGISFGPYNKATESAGDFIFSRSAADQASIRANMLFVPFAQKVCSTGDRVDSCTAETKLSLYGLKPVTAVKAAADGKVDTLQTTATETSLVTTSDAYPGYAVGYDHIYQPTVKAGDVVKAGQVIGIVAPYGDGTFGRIELYIRKDTADPKTVTRVCPFDYLDPKVEPAVSVSVKTFMTDWNGFIGSEVHRLTDMKRVGCLASHTTE